MDIVQNFINSLYFFFHQVTEHFVVLVEIFSDQCSRSVCTVSGTESVVYIAICIRSQFLGEFFLAFLNSSIGSLLFFVCIIFSQTAGFAFLFSVETEVLEQQHFTRLQSSSLYGSFFAHTVVSKLHLNTQQLFEMLQNVLQGELVSRAFRTTEVRTDNYTTAIGQNLLQSRKGGTDTCVICNVEIFVQGYVEVHTNECLFSGKVKLINCHNTLFYLKVLLISF